METSTSMMVMMTLAVCDPSKHDAFLRRQAFDQTNVRRDHKASVIPSRLGNQKWARRPFGCH